MGVSTGTDVVLGPSQTHTASAAQGSDPRAACCKGAGLGPGMWLCCCSVSSRGPVCVQGQVAEYSPQAVPARDRGSDTPSLLSPKGAPSPYSACTVGNCPRPWQGPAQVARSSCLGSRVWPDPDSCCPLRATWLPSAHTRASCRSGTQRRGRSSQCWRATQHASVSPGQPAASPRLGMATALLDWPHLPLPRRGARLER